MGLCFQYLLFHLKNHNMLHHSFKILIIILNFSKYYNFFKNLLMVKTLQYFLFYLNRFILNTFNFLLAIFNFHIHYYYFLKFFLISFC